MDFSSGAWQLWVVSGLILGALELKLSGYVMLWFRVGAFAAGLLATMGVSFNAQLVVFNAVSVALLLGSRTLFRRFFMQDATSVRHGVEAMLNSDAVVVEPIPGDGFGTFASTASCGPRAGSMRRSPKARGCGSRTSKG